MDKMVGNYGPNQKHFPLAIHRQKPAVTKFMGVAFRIVSVGVGYNTSSVVKKVLGTSLSKLNIDFQASGLKTE